jgi:hypothetical protein
VETAIMAHPRKKTPVKLPTDFKLVELTCALVKDASIGLNSDEKFQSDITYITKRFESEGLSFLTKTLPSFAKAIDRSLGTLEKFDPPTSFKRFSGSGLPRFLSGLTSRIFQRNGQPRLQPDICSIKDVRTICYVLYKLELPYSKQQLSDYCDKYVATDRQLPSYGFPVSDRAADILSTASAVVHDIFKDFDGKVPSVTRRFGDSYHLGDDVKDTPIFGFQKYRHGPGSLSTGESVTQKYAKLGAHRFPMLEDFHPIYHWGYCNAGALGNSAVLTALNPAAASEHPDEWASKLSEFWFKGKETLTETWWNLYSERQVKWETPTSSLEFVPKDSRGPRTICMEPLELQYVQQGLLSTLAPHIEERSRWHINFRDQSINAKFALQGSLDGNYSTVDLSDASDRVSTWLVEKLFPTRIFNALFAARSPQVELPDGRILTSMRKFAPMGSSICFPVESVVFYALAVASLVRTLGLELHIAKDLVYVYGDDIIIASVHPSPIMESFPWFGLKVNDSKSFTTPGLFRESCGCDAVLGERVEPIRLKKLLSSSRWSDIVGHLDLETNLFSFGYYRAAAVVAESVIRRAPVLNQNATSSTLGFTVVRGQRLPPSCEPRLIYVADDQFDDLCRSPIKPGKLWKHVFRCVPDKSWLAQKSSSGKILRPILKDVAYCLDRQELVYRRPMTASAKAEVSLDERELNRYFCLAGPEFISGRYTPRDSLYMVVRHTT